MKNKVLSYALILFFAGVAGVSAKLETASKDSVWTELELLNVKHVPRDVETALAKKDYRFAGVLTGTG